MAPASLAATGMAAALFHLDTLRMVRNWKTSILMPASASRATFIWNAQLAQYFTGWPVNKRTPVIAEMTKAVQGHGNASRRRSVTEQFAEARPISGASP